MELRRVNGRIESRRAKGGRWGWEDEYVNGEVIMM